MSVQTFEIFSNETGESVTVETSSALNLCAPADLMYFVHCMDDGIRLAAEKPEHFFAMVEVTNRDTGQRVSMRFYAYKVLNLMFAGITHIKEGK